MTANVLRVKSTWQFALSHATAHTSATAELWDHINTCILELLTRAQNEGLLAPDIDLTWTRQVYYALLNEALTRSDTDQAVVAQDPDAMATLVIDTLLHGAGPHH